MANELRHASGPVLHHLLVTFMTLLCLGLGLDLALLASSMNVESGPRFAKIWLFTGWLKVQDTIVSVKKSTFCPIL